MLVILSLRNFSSVEADLPFDPLVGLVQLFFLSPAHFTLSAKVQWGRRVNRGGTFGAPLYPLWVPPLLFLPFWASADLR